MSPEQERVLRLNIKARRLFLERIVELNKMLEKEGNPYRIRDINSLIEINETFLSKISTIEIPDGFEVDQAFLS